MCMHMHVHRQTFSRFDTCTTAQVLPRVAMSAGRESRAEYASAAFWHAYAQSCPHAAQDATTAVVIIQLQLAIAVCA